MPTKTARRDYSEQLPGFVISLKVIILKISWWAVFPQKQFNQCSEASPPFTNSLLMFYRKCNLLGAISKSSNPIKNGVSVYVFFH